MATSPKHGTRSDILVVGNDQVTRKRIAAALARSGLRALSVESLSDARQAARTAYFPLVILDRDLGEGDGRDLCREYRARHFGRPVRILMLATAATSNAATSALAAGADDYLDKSCADDELLARIMRLHTIACGPPPTVSALDAESTRLRALRAFDVLDTPPEQPYDDITRIAAIVCNTPIALISLVDERRQWFKSAFGLTVREVPREQAFTTYAIEGTDVFVVEDASADARFADSPLVRGAPSLRFYAGAPLITADGVALGAICVMDRRPRQLEANGREVLPALARQVMGLLEQRREHGQLQDALVARRASDADLLRALAMFREAFENAPIGMALVSVHGRWLRVNRALCEIVGFSEAELLRTTFQAITHPDDLSSDLSHASELLAGEVQSYELEKRYIHRRGHTVWISLSTSLVRDDQQQPLYFISQIQDITGRKQLERARTEFVAVVSHELRTPITAIRGSLGLLAASAAGELPAKARQLTELADRNAQRLHRLIDDILDLDKMESSSFRYELDLFEVDAFVVRATEVMQPYADQFGVGLKVVTPPVSARIKADEKRMQQVLTNLISNAVKFSPRNTDVEIAVRQLRGDVRFEITDRGSGIPQAYHATIFQKFGQTPIAPVAPIGGTGLGLSICKSIVAAHSGRIGFDTTPNVGTTFWFEVPAIGSR
jgi:PAS domain S-box-containing protein